MGSLMQTTIKLLHEDPRSIPVIYRDSGIPYYWLKKFSAGEYKNPSVNRVQKLYEFLSGAQLKLVEKTIIL